MNIQKSSFHPISGLDKLSNYKRYYRIERDGGIFERIFLDIPDSSLREHLIFMHYLKNYVKIFCNEMVGVNIISRDNPWDFKIELSTNEVFNVEITAIAEDAGLFEKFKREERFILKSLEDKIPFHELEKLNKMFPSSEIENVIQNHKESGIIKDALVFNPYYGRNPNLFLSSVSRIKEPLENLIKNAIESKEAKNHSEKEITVLIIDNRTLTYEYSDLQSASNSLHHFYEKSSFKELWFYTGYASDSDGNNAEFSLSPLKVTKAQEEVLKIMRDENPPNEDGIIYT